MFYDSFQAWWWPFVFITLAGVVPTNMWRWIGVVVVGRLDESSEWLVLVRFVASSLVAAVIAQFVFFPSGALAAAPLWLRLSAVAVGFISFLGFGRRIIVGVIVAETVLLSGMSLFAKF